MKLSIGISILTSEISIVKIKCRIRYRLMYIKFVVVYQNIGVNTSMTLVDRNLNINDMNLND